MLALLLVCWFGAVSASEPTDRAECARCTERDVQKMVLSAVAGALLTMALTGRAHRRSAQTWTRTRNSEAQTYEEPAAPGPLVIPPVVQYLPMPFLPALAPPPPEIIYEAPPLPSTAIAACQTVPSGVTSAAQTDWHGAPIRCERHTQTSRPAERFSAMSQTLATASLHVFSQTTGCQVSASTQCEEEEEEEDENLPPLHRGVQSPRTPHSPRRRGPALMSVRTQTQAQGCHSAASQTRTGYVHEASVQTASHHDRSASTQT
jgi:hypothetical protein